MSVLTRLGRLRGRAAVDANVLRHLRHVVAGPVVLCEPRSADQAARVINAWHVVDTYRRPGAQLVVHGRDTWWPEPRVAALVQALALPNAWLHPPAPAPIRAALLEGADVYVADVYVADVYVTDGAGSAGTGSDGEADHVASVEVPEPVARRAAAGVARVVPLVPAMGAGVLAEAIAEAMVAARAVPDEVP